MDNYKNDYKNDYKINYNNKRVINLYPKKFNNKMTKTLTESDINKLTLDVKLLTLDNLTNIGDKISNLSLDNSIVRNLVKTELDPYMEEQLMERTLYVFNESTTGACNVFLTRGSPWSDKTYDHAIIIYDMCFFYNGKQLFVSFQEPTDMSLWKIMDDESKELYKEHILLEQACINYFK